ncbi:hypothetical protein PsorP6_012450 [Peronosclerospora sorghi]|uniref:Uncharacterized protein n=1 Tax=Peronosclerospora sorghi TaxID=230839 RepID=A0ACC0WEY2_9STRA|nr:hypothetical protein PsorP6_012450 [Peronosclerospora sorghi]
MLRHAGDVRVFESSEDIILPTRSHRRPPAPRGTNCSRHHDDDNEDEHLHPHHHPLRLQTRAFHRTRHLVFETDARGGSDEPTRVTKPVHRSLELVYLPSGEIRARKDCPQSLDDVPRTHDWKRESGRCGWNDAEASDDESARETRATCPRERRNRHERDASRPSISSTNEKVRVFASEEEEDDDDEWVSLPKYEKRSHQVDKRVLTSCPKTSQRASRAAERPQQPRQEMKHTRACLNRQDRTEDEDGSSRTVDRREAPEPATDEKRPIREEHMDTTPTRQAAARLETGSRTVPFVPKPSVDPVVSDASPTDDPTLQRLEKALQHEQKRVLKLTTHLLEAERKQQELADRLEAVETQLAAKDKESQEQEADRTVHEPKKALENDQAEQIAKACRPLAEGTRWPHDTTQGTAPWKEMETPSRAIETATRDDELHRLKSELDERDKCLYVFLTELKRWKDKIAREGVPQTGDIRLDDLWREFPTFPADGSIVANHVATCADEPHAVDDTDAKTHALQNKVKTFEETREKDVDLTEMGEMGLPNGMTGHRLRGNLLVSKQSPAKGGKQTEKEREERLQRARSMLDARRQGRNTPKVFVQMGENEVYEYASPIAVEATKPNGQSAQRLERSRVGPSASRSERVRSPCARRKKPATPSPRVRTSSRLYLSRRGECPPRCGSWTSTTALKGGTGVPRPWI